MVGFTYLLTTAAVLVSLIHEASSFHYSLRRHFHVQLSPLRPRLRCNSRVPQCAVTLYLSSSSPPNGDEQSPYFLRRALMADLSQAAQILADGFYSENHTFSRWWEKIQTQMSLESNLPNPISHPHHEMWVACQNPTGQVIAFCEVDNRPPTTTMSTQSDDLIVRPYMCNLAVHEDWRKQGLAQQMIRQCEASVELWQDQYVLYLKVKEHNIPAINLYTKLGYEVFATQLDSKTQETLLVMKRDWTDVLPQQTTMEMEDGDVGEDEEHSHEATFSEVSTMRTATSNSGPTYEI